MKTNPLSTLAALAVMVLGTTLANAQQISFTWATVGDPNNPADTRNSGSIPGIGSVGYMYEIATTEVNLNQYTAFLNAVDPSGANPYALYNSSIAINSNIKGISYNPGAVAGSKYSVIGSGLRPVTYVSWNDAARFVNWLQNGQGSGSTESGVYDMSQPWPARSSLATYFLPSENEWYKAAYYDPTKGGTNYWLYPTRSDTAPGNAIGNQSNQANYYANDFATTQSSSYSSSQNYLTDGGAFSGSASYYGTYDQGGNVWEWNEASLSGSSRGMRGGSWYYDVPNSLQSSTRVSGNPTVVEGANIGFRVARVAQVPEPSTALSAVMLGAGWLVWRRRKVTL